MTLFDPSEFTLAAAMARLVMANPFVPERIELERDILGAEFVDTHSDWNLRPRSGAQHPNLEGLERRAQMLVDHAEARLAEGVPLGDAEHGVYELLVLLLLYYRFRERFEDVVARDHAKPQWARIAPSTTRKDWGWTLVFQPVRSRPLKSWSQSSAARALGPLARIT